MQEWPRYKGCHKQTIDWPAGLLRAYLEDQTRLLIQCLQHHLLLGLNIQNTCCPAQNSPGAHGFKPHTIVLNTLW